MAKPFKVLRDRMSPESQQRSEALKRRLLMEASVAELRKAMNLTQEKLAMEMSISQAAVSSIENESDILISTLRRVLEAMGGTLKVIAVLPDKHEIEINQFREISTG